MSNVELLSFADEQALARAAADLWLQDVLDAIKSPKPYCTALSGGRIARRFFDAVVEIAKARQASLQQVHFFWGDERCVSPADPESNFGVANELLLAPLGIPKTQIHRVAGERPPQAAAAQAAAELLRIAPANAAGQPIIDLIFLGLGEDGHVASLFPGESAQTQTDQAIYRPVISPKPPPHRVTLGYPAIEAARQVWVLASGAGKQTALRESLTPEGRTSLARVLQFRRSTKIFTDIDFK